MGLDAFNVIAGLVTIASLFFSAWVYWTGKSKEAVENQRLRDYAERLRSSYSVTQATINQARLLAAMSDREETTKKELKHLAVALLASLSALNEMVGRELVEARKYAFGIPRRYLEMQDQHLPSPEGAKETPSLPI